MTSTPPLKCECEKPNPGVYRIVCMTCGLPIHPAAEHEKDLPLKPLPDTHPLRSKLPDTNPTTEPKCCEKCLDGDYDSNEEWYEHCNNPSCPCHTPPVEGEWEKEFDVWYDRTQKIRDFVREPYEKTEKQVSVLDIQTRELFKSFITTLLHDEREKERERIVKMCEEMKQAGLWKLNSTLDSLRDKLTNNV